jgi:hypothetical protein
MQACTLAPPSTPYFAARHAVVVNRQINDIKRQVEPGATPDNTFLATD